MKKPKALDRPEGIIARARYERNHGFRSQDPWNIGIDRLYELHVERRPQKSIALLARVSQQCMRNFYQQYLRELEPFSGVTYREYREMRWTKEYASRLPTTPMVAAVAFEASERGLTITPDFHYTKGKRQYISRHSLLVNGHRCKLHFLTAAFTREGSNAFYARASVESELKRDYDYSIFLLRVPGYAPRFFIIPVSEIRRHARLENKKHVLYLPLGNYTPTSHGPALRYRSFLEAWSLLKQRRLAA